MGLPIWRVPEDEQPKDATKTDPTADARSPIRRRPSPSPARPLRRSRRDSDLRHIPRLRHTGRTTTIPEVHNSNGSRSSPRPPPARLYREQAQLPSISQVIEERGDDANFRRVRLPPAPEIPSSERTVVYPGSRLRFDSPPRVSADERNVPLTVDFAPARNASQALRRSDPTAHSRATAMVVSSSGAALPVSDDDQTMPEVMSRESGLSQRAMELNERARGVLYARRARPDGPVDGLGDRNRSPSAPAHGYWDNMLNTITPDERLPSVDSSFTSAAASQSFNSSSSSNVQSLSSSRTSLDALMTDDEDDTCEFIDMWDISSEETDTAHATNDETEHDVRAFVRGFHSMDRPTPHRRTRQSARQIVRPTATRRISSEGTHTQRAPTQHTDVTEPPRREQEPQSPGHPGSTPDLHPLDRRPELLIPQYSPHSPWSPTTDGQTTPSERDFSRVASVTNRHSYHESDQSRTSQRNTDIFATTPQDRAPSLGPRLRLHSRTPSPVSSTVVDTLRVPRSPELENDYLRSVISRDPGALTMEERSERRARELLWGFELTQMQAVIRGLARRRDIPEEWWISTGLTHATRNANVRERL